jgi:hypothetical protein
MLGSLSLLLGAGFGLYAKAKYQRTTRIGDGQLMR